MQHFATDFYTNALYRRNGVYSHTRDGKRPSSLPLQPALKLFANFQDFIFEYFDMEHTFRNFDVGERFHTKSAKSARSEIKITHAERYTKSDYLFSNIYS